MATPSLSPNSKEQSESCARGSLLARVEVEEVLMAGLVDDIIHAGIYGPQPSTTSKRRQEQLKVEVYPEASLLVRRGLEIEKRSSQLPALCVRA